MTPDGLTQEERVLADTALETAAGLAATGRPWRETWNVLAKLGWPGVLAPPEAGGFGGSRTDLLLLSRALGAHLVNTPMLPDAAIVSPLLDGAPSALRARLLEGHVNGTGRVAFAHQESRADPGVEAMRTRVGEGALSGAKRMTLFGGDARALVVSAWWNDAPSLVVIDLPNTKVSVRTYRLIDGAEAADFVFDAVPVSDAQVLATGEEAKRLTEDAVLLGILAALGEAIGCVESALTETVRHLKTREQFGVPLATFQVLRHRVADMYIACEELFSLGLAAARAAPAEFAAAVCSAKIYLGQDGVRAVEQAVQMHGAMGVTEECLAGRLLKRMIVLDRLFGGADYHITHLGSSLETR